MPAPVSRSHAGPLAATTVAVGTLLVAWAGLYRDVGTGHLLALCVVAVLPALAALAIRGRPGLVVAAVVVAVPLALSLALRLSPFDLATFDDDAWAAVRALLPDGLAAGADAGLPVGPDEEIELVALLDTAFAVLVSAAAWQFLGRRRPVGGLVIVGLGLAYRWTVEPPASATAAGVLALIALTAALALATADGPDAGSALRRAGGVIAVGGVSVAVAAGIGAGPASADDAWWGWRDWDVGGTASGSGGGLDLRQSYGKLDWPETPRVALTVQSDRSRPLRAVSLDQFDGVAFTLSSAGTSSTLPVRGGVLRVADPAPGRAEEATQTIFLVGASTQVLLTSGRPQRITGPFRGVADRIGDSVRVEAPIGGGDSYTVRTRIPRPRPSDLVAEPAYDLATAPLGSTILRPGSWNHPVVVPLWGSDAPPVPAEALGPYARVRDLAVAVAGDAETPYAAVNRIEAHLRRDYVYDEQPPYPTSVPDDGSGEPLGTPPPLVDFLLGSRRGFCQHFAGSMAVMLRSIGIPARVAVGYTGGRFDPQSKRWVVLDRDAHSWVEVWFPNEGWLPFDPTPGRAAPNPASVSSPDYSPSPIEIDIGGIADRAVAPPAPDGSAPATPAPAEVPTESAPVAAGDDGGRGGGTVSLWWALLVVPALGLVAPGGRAARRLRGRRRGDERRRVLAAAHELEATLARLGWAPSAAASPSERAAAIRATSGVDASGLYRRAASARFAPEPPGAGAGDAAWREVSRLRRAVHRRASWSVRLRAALGVPPGRRATVGR